MAAPMHCRLQVGKVRWMDPLDGSPECVTCACIITSPIRMFGSAAPAATWECQGPYMSPVRLLAKRQGLLTVCAGRPDHLALLSVDLVILRNVLFWTNELDGEPAISGGGSPILKSTLRGLTALCAFFELGLLFFHSAALAGGSSGSGDSGGGSGGEVGTATAALWYVAVTWPQQRGRYSSVGNTEAAAAAAAATAAAAAAAAAAQAPTSS